MTSFVNKLLATWRGEPAYLLIFGYIRHHQKSQFLNIPNEIIIEILKFYFVFVPFMNGENILSRDWKKLHKGKIIEYESAGGDIFDAGTHIHSGKLINITYSGGCGMKAIIKELMAPKRK